MDEDETEAGGNEPDQNAKPVSNGAATEVDGPGSQGRELLNLSNFLALAFGGGALVIIALGAVYQRLDIWTVALAVLAVILGLAMLTRLRDAVWFQGAQSSVLVIALVATGIFITAHKPVHKASHHRQTHPVVRTIVPKIEVAVPRVAGPGDVSKVSCPETVSGSVTGDIPSGDIVAVGYKPSNIGIWTFSAQADIRHGRWSATVYVGQSADAGKLFAMAYVLMQSSWAHYLVQSFDQAAPHDTWWDATSLPPSTKAYVYQTVERTKGSC